MFPAIENRWRISFFGTGHSFIQFYFQYMVTSFIYFTIQEAIWGRTIGKKILKMQVVDENMNKPTLWQIIIRNSFRIVDQFLGGPGLGSFFALVNKQEKRLGDVVAKTRVISERQLQEAKLKKKVIMTNDNSFEEKMRRFFAFAVDHTLISILVKGIHWGLIVLNFNYNIFSTIVHKLSLETIEIYLWGSLYNIAIIFLYYFIQEITWGTSIGKNVFEFKVVNLQGNKPTVKQIFIRNIFRIVDQILRYPGIGSLFLIFGKRHRRLGDIVAKTVVVTQREVLIENQYSNEQDSEEIKGENKVKRKVTKEYIVLILATIFIGIICFITEMDKREGFAYRIRDFDLYENDFQIVANKMLSLKDLSDEYTLSIEYVEGDIYYNLEGQYIQLSDVENNAMNNIMKAFISPIEMNRIKVYTNRVTFCTTGNWYAVVYIIDDSKPQFMSTPTENFSIKVGKIRTNWYHIVSY
jgi:uncharacterized RDD family membrane protein YckC